LLFSAFLGLALQGPVAFGKGLTADSCGGSFGFSLSLRQPAPNSLLAGQYHQRT